MKAFLAILLLSAIPLASQATDKWDYQLGEGSLFENRSGSDYCERLTVRGQLVGWVTRLAEAGQWLVFRSCFREEPLDEGKSSQGAIDGGVRAGWYGLKLGGPVKAQKLVLPKMNEFSNPSFCRTAIAYWGEGPNHSRHAMVFRLDTYALVQSRYAGRAVLGTDYKYVLNPPSWANDCSSVRFEDIHFKQKIRFRFRTPSR